MQTYELEDEIKNKKVSGVYLIFGDETYDVLRYRDKIINTFLTPSLGINYFVIDKTNIDSLKDSIEEVSFLGSKKAINICDTGLKVNTEYLSNVDKENILIVITEPSIDKRTKEYKEIIKIAKVIECAKLKSKDACMFVKQTLNAYKLSISNELLEYFVQSCTTDKLTLINEMKKVVAYIEKGGTVTKELLDEVLVKTLDAKVFDMLDTLFAGNIQKTMEQFDDLLEQKTYIGIIASTVFKQIKQIYMIKLLDEKSKKQNVSYDVQKELSIHPFVYSKLLGVKNKYTKEKIEEILLSFAQYDRDVKLGKIPAEIGLKNLILTI